jgi:NADPH-dependent glutamate synthase beta subunit-like oxidoreductase
MESRVPRSLFEPYKIKGLHVKNRLMRSSMVLSMAGPDGTVTDDLLSMYRIAAQSGVGLCCTGGMAVNADGRLNWQQLGVWSDDQIGGLARLVDNVHAYGDGCVLFGQILSRNAECWGYSDSRGDSPVGIDGLSEEQIWSIIEAFGTAAVRVREAGFDGIELHGAHGYLISQFLSPATNTRTDRWGGSVEKRATFLLEICAAVRRGVGEDFPLGVKMNTADFVPRGHWPAQTAQIARMLADDGVDLIEMSGGLPYSLELREALRRRAAEKECYFRDAIGPFTEALAGTEVALAVVGGIRTPAVMEEMRSLGVDLVSMARPWLCEPDLAKRIAAGDLRPAKCVSSLRACNLCLMKLPTGSVQCERFYPGDCRMSCPIEQDNPTYMAHVAAGEMEQAVRVVKADNPLANSLSRVCHAPCETACRGKNGEPVSLRDLKRFVVDWGREHNIGIEAPRPKTQRRGKVAVVGSGPAGLTCAYWLAQRGYKPTVFEKEAVAGGMLAWGIPTYRLPRDVVVADVDYVRSAGVEIQTSVALGRDFTVGDLFNRGYCAVFLATGAPTSRSIDVPGIELAGVTQGLDFLRAVGLGEPARVGRRVVVVGGGNVAIDSAMTALRLGAEEVTIVCLEQLDELPAHRDQVEDALEEGITIKPGWGPLRIVGAGAVTGVELVRCSSVFDDWGAFNPAYCETDVERTVADTVILAIGQAPGLDWLAEGSSIAVSDVGALEVEGFTLATSMPGVFAGGDAVVGAGSVVEAAGSGRYAAESIDRYLTSGAGSSRSYLTPASDPETRGDRFAPYVPMVRPTAFRDVAETRLAEGSQRAAVPKLPLAQRMRSFAEITGTISEDEATAQARRCQKYDLNLETDISASLDRMVSARALVFDAEEDTP